VRGRYEEAMNIQEIEIANLDQRYGHLRMAGRTALQRLGRDTIMAEVREGDEATSRPFFVQIAGTAKVRRGAGISDQGLACAIRLSVKQVAHRLGRDASWVSQYRHHQTLVNDLPDDVRAQCAEGQTARPGQQREHRPGKPAFDQEASWPLPWESRVSP